MSGEAYLRLVITEAALDQGTVPAVDDTFFEEIAALAAGISDESRREMEEGMREARYAYGEE